MAPFVVLSAFRRNPRSGDQMSSPPPEPPKVPKPETIDATFRNGSLTAISVMLGFSLSFVGRWAGLPGPWEKSDLVAVVLIVVGIILQIRATASLLSVNSLIAAKYRRSVRIFLSGLALVSLGVAIAVGGDIFGYGQRILNG